jgi:Mg/Co/Ni transporter MgtE
VAVDVGASGLLRRLGIEGAYRILARNLKLPTPERYIDWEDVDPVETSIASIRLRVPHAGLTELHPADLATIIDQLAPRDRAGVLAALDDEAVADAIEEMEPETQVEVLEGLAPERAADILEEMSPDDAADLIAELPPETAEALLQLMEPEEAEDVRRLMSYEEHTAGGMMTTEPVILPPDATVADALARVRQPELSPALAAQVYVCRPPMETPTGRFIGIAHIQRLLREPPSVLVSGVVDSTIEPLHPNAPLAAITHHLATYNMVAAPVVDEDDHLLGAVTVDDVLDHLLPDDWRHQGHVVEGTGDEAVEVGVPDGS